MVDGIVLHVNGGESPAQHSVNPATMYQSRWCEDLQRYRSEAGTLFVQVCDEMGLRAVAVQVGRLWIFGEVDLLIGDGRHSCAIALLVDDGNHSLNGDCGRNRKRSPIIDSELSDIA